LTDKSQEGFQFVKGFGGMGAFLRYQITEVNYSAANDNSDDDFDPEEDFI
jgi:peptide chain release factor subunit 1